MLFVLSIERVNGCPKATLLVSWCIKPRSLKFHSWARAWLGTQGLREKLFAPDPLPPSLQFYLKNVKLLRAKDPTSLQPIISTIHFGSFQNVFGHWWCSIETLRKCFFAWKRQVGKERAIPVDPPVACSAILTMKRVIGGNLKMFAGAFYCMSARVTSRGHLVTARLQMIL